MQNSPAKIIVHHSATDIPTPQFNAINKWHRDRAFPKSRLGFFVGYHFVIEKDGTVVQAREGDEEGAHTVGQNFSSIGICLVGNFSVSNPTEKQINALGALLSRLVATYSLDAYDIVPHRTYKQTECYGARLANTWAALVFLKYEIERLTKLLYALQNPQ